jgi:hypothetical protein
MYMCGLIAYTCQTTCFVTGSMVYAFFWQLGCSAQHTSFTMRAFYNMLHARLHYLRGFRFSQQRQWRLWSTVVRSRMVTTVILYHQHNRSHRLIRNVNQFCFLKLRGVIFTTFPIDKHRCEYLMSNKFLSTV